MHSIAKACVNWRLQAEVIAATLWVNNHEQLANSLFDVVEELELLWSLEHGPAYSEEITEPLQHPKIIVSETRASVAEIRTSNVVPIGKGKHS